MVLLKKLGEPTEDIAQVDESSENINNKNSNDRKMTEADTFLKDIESKRSKSSIEFVRDMKIFYQAPVPASQNTSINNTNNSNNILSGSIITSKDNSPNHSIFFFICRRVTSETDPIILIYLMVSEIIPLVRAGGTFDLVIDSGSFNTDAELPLWSYSKFWGRLKTFLGAACATYLRKIYVLYPSIVVVMSVCKIIQS